MFTGYARDRMAGFEERVFRPAPASRRTPGEAAGTASDIIEHPELVAQRLIQFARLVGTENVIAVRYQYPRRRSAAEQLGQLLRVDLGVVAVAVVEQDMRGVGLGGQ